MEPFSICLAVAEPRLYYSSHAAKLTRDTLFRFIPQVLDWLPISPDLNPIENLWDILKDRLGNEVYEKEDKLLARLKYEWEHIQPELVHECYSAFLTRCIFCARHNGETLSGKWNEVHFEQNKYRAKLVQIQADTQNGLITKYAEQ